MNIEYREMKMLKPYAWATANHVLNPDFRLLRESLENNGWLAPLVVSGGDNIVDGVHRWSLARDYQTIDQQIPVVVVEVDQSEAMVMHIQLNRSRGVPVNKKVSRLVKALLRGGKYDPEDLRMMLRMSADEFDLLADGTLVKMLNVKEHDFSKAWVPVETGGREVGQGISIERPPNKDE